jgi:signal transduction histidine kinase
MTARTSLPTVEPQPYGDPTELNTARLILDSVGKDVLAEIMADYLGLLQTSAAIYETNGDYAQGIFSSGWCRKMDETSRNLCGTADNREALVCGKWHCHESCWSVSKASIETGQPADEPCLGGIRIFAVPVRAGGKIVGSLNFGYGDPPTDLEKMQELSDRFGLSLQELRKVAESYQHREPWIIEVAKHQLATAAKLLGVMIERRQSEQELIRLSGELQRKADELARSNRDLEQFASVASHDLQEPLRAVAGCVQILQKQYEGQLDERANELIALTVDGVGRMQTLINDLLSYSRVSTRGKAFEAADCQAALDVALVNLKAAVQEASAVVSHDALPVVRADPTQLMQLLLNLLSNAIKFRSTAPPIIHVGAKRQNGHWVVSVKDNGIGIEPKYSERVFAVFQRLHTRTEYPGTGIGLAICKKIVERHGGRIWVDSEPGKGSTFSFTIPDRGANS